MQAGISAARKARTRHRYELRTLTYVTLDQANGGVVRNLTHDGIAVQTVAPVLPRQQMRVRFDLRYPRLRIQARGEVVWATFSGQCGIRFLDLPPRMARQIDEWIFGNLLEGIALHAAPDGPVFTGPAGARVEEDGLVVSAAPLKVIELPTKLDPVRASAEAAEPFSPQAELDWLSRPLSGRSLTWTVNALVVVAALLLFSLVFLSVTGEPPKWPLAMVGGATIVVAALYWGFFKVFGGASPGERLARLAGSDFEDDAEASGARFR
jgi:hypothetical protein